MRTKRTRAEDLYSEWHERLTEIAKRYRAVDLQLPFLFEIGAGSLVMIHGLNPENVEEWVEGRIQEFERLAEKFGNERNPKPPPMPKRRRSRPSNTRKPLFRLEQGG
jgi:hypothetical protein